MLNQFDAVVSPANRVLRVAGHYLIDSLDDAGYLRADLNEAAIRLGLPEDGIPAGTRFVDIPDDWRCPNCGIAKSDFHAIED